jgi:hypothetical protein
MTESIGTRTMVDETDEVGSPAWALHRAEQIQEMLEGPPARRPIDLFSLGLAAIDLHDDDARTIWFALREYLDKLKANLHTGFDGSEDFGFEDDMFLGGQIGQTARVLFLLQQAGFAERYNAS